MRVQSFLVVVAGYLSSCAVIAALFSYWQGADSVERAIELFAIWLLSAVLVALPGYAFLRAGMAAFGMTNILAFGVAGAMNGAISVMLMGGLSWHFPVIGFAAGVVAGLVEYTLMNGNCRWRREAK